jgi:HEAT repeat protein
MKKVTRIAAVAALTATIAVIGYATPPKDFTYNQPLAETNLLIGVASDNLGLRLSSASILAEVGTSRSVVPLMRMLHNGTPEERIVAALALAKIRDGRGTYAVQRAASFDPNENVRLMAAWYFNEYAVPKAEPAEVVTSLISWNVAPTPYPEYYDETEAFAGGLGH